MKINSFMDNPLHDSLAFPRRRRDAHSGCYTTNIETKSYMSLEISKTYYSDYCYNVLFSYSRFRNKHSPTFINFWNFYQGLRSYYGLKRLKFYYS